VGCCSRPRSLTISSARLFPGSTVSQTGLPLDQHRLRQPRYRIPRGLRDWPVRLGTVDGPRRDQTRVDSLRSVVLTCFDIYPAGQRLLRFRGIPLSAGNWRIRQLARRDESGFRIVPQARKRFGNRSFRQRLVHWRGDCPLPRCVYLPSVGAGASLYYSRVARLLWLMVRRSYRTPQEYPRISESERQMILADSRDLYPEAGKPRTPCVSLLRLPQTWGTIVAKGLTDPVWFCVTDWFPIYLVAKAFR